MSKTKKKQSTLETVKNENERLTLLTENREKENRPKSYSEYLSSALTEAKESYRAANEAAELRRARATAGYGETGERIGRAGLSVSGYADYLTKQAESDYRGELADARESYDAEVRRGEAEYAKYLDRHEAAETQILQNAIRKMTSDKIEGYEEGYRYAVTSGLSGERAELFARMCDAYGNRDFRTLGTSARISMLREIMYNGLDYDSAYLYARALGASGGTAKRIAEYAAGIREQYEGFSEEP